MAILIEKKWDDEGEERVTLAVLPSGKILFNPNEYSNPKDIEGIKGVLNNYMEQADPKADPTDRGVGIFKYAALYRRSSSSAGMFIIEDPQEARKIIQEAGLK